MHCIYRANAYYADMTSSLPPPKVVMESAHAHSAVWGRLQNKVVEMRARDMMYLLLRDKKPVQERLYRIKLKVDPYCLYCPGAEFGGIIHYFCECQRTVET